MSHLIIMFLMFDCWKLIFSKQNTTKPSPMSVFTIPLFNSEFMVLFINMRWTIFAIVSMSLAGLFITGKTLSWKARLKKNYVKIISQKTFFSCPLNLLTTIFILCRKK